MKPAFLSEDEDELVEALTLSLTRRDLAIFSHRTINVDTTVKANWRHNDRHRRSDLLTDHQLIDVRSILLRPHHLFIGASIERGESHVAGAHD